jgi:hypothetical protein
VVEDVVGQFTVDRIFLTAGRMLTPDDALRELVWGIVSEVGRTREEMPGAVSIVCPGPWDPPTRARVETIVAGLGLQLPRIAEVADCYLAAADAFARLPHRQAVAAQERPDLPALESSFKRGRPAPVAPAAVVPQVTRVKSSRPAIIGAVVAILAIVAVLAVVLARNARAATAPVPAPPRPAAASPVAYPGPPASAVATLDPSVDTSRGEP